MKREFISGFGYLTVDQVQVGEDDEEEEEEGEIYHQVFY